MNAFFEVRHRNYGVPFAILSFYRDLFDLGWLSVQFDLQVTDLRKEYSISFNLESALIVCEGVTFF